MEDLICLLATVRTLKTNFDAIFYCYLILTLLLAINLIKTKEKSRKKLSRVMFKKICLMGWWWMCIMMCSVEGPRYQGSCLRKLCIMMCNVNKKCTFQTWSLISDPLISVVKIHVKYV